MKQDLKTGRIQQIYDDTYMRELAEEYADKRNAKEISIREEIPLQTVYHYIRKFKMEKPRRLHSIDEDYFEKIDTEAKAYLLGFIIADGCISHSSKSNPRANRLIVSLSYKDRTVLELLKKETKSEYKILDYIPQGTYSTNMMTRYVINSIKMCDDLAKYGVIAQKTGKEYLPDLSKEMIRHCVRGFFDGDGHVSDRDGGENKTIGFTSGDVTILEQIKDLFSKELSTISKARIVPDHRADKNAFSIKYHTKADIEKIRDYLYKDAHYYLDRKYNALL